MNDNVSLPYARYNGLEIRTMQQYDAALGITETA